MEFVAWLTAILDQDAARLTDPTFCGPVWPTTDQLLARVAADRQILALHREVGFSVFTMRGEPEQRERYCNICQQGDEDELAYPCQTLLLMASPFADRAGFQEAWKS